jgi:hypothetical protein
METLHIAINITEHKSTGYGAESKYTTDIIIGGINPQVDTKKLIKVVRKAIKQNKKLNQQILNKQQNTLL